MLQAEAAFSAKDFLRAASFYAKVFLYFLLYYDSVLVILYLLTFLFSVILLRFLMDDTDTAEITLRHFGIWLYVSNIEF